MKVNSLIEIMLSPTQQIQQRSQQMQNPQQIQAPQGNKPRLAYSQQYMANKGLLSQIINTLDMQAKNPGENTQQKLQSMAQVNQKLREIMQMLGQ